MTPRPDDWLFDSINRLEQTEIRHAAELRAEMQRGFQKLEDALTKHEQDDKEVADRVLMIETERAMEAKQATKQGMWAGLLAAAGISGAIEAAKHLWFK